MLSSGKGDTASMSATKVNLPSITPKELDQFVDVLVATKYMADLSQLTRVLGEDVRSTLDAFKQDLNNSLPRQIRSVAQEVYNEVEGKRTSAESTTPGQVAVIGNGMSSGSGSVNFGTNVANPNLQQPYF